MFENYEYDTEEELELTASPNPLSNKYGRVSVPIEDDITYNDLMLCVFMKGYDTKW